MLKRTRFIWIVLLILVVALAGCGSSDPDPDPDPADETPEETVSELFDKGREVFDLYYEIVMEGPGMDVEGKVWVKQNKMKMETVAAGQTSIMIIDGDAKIAYTYMPTENIAYKMPFDSTDGEFSVTPSDFLDYDESIVELGETDFINGVECVKVFISEEHTDEYPVTMWIHKEYGLPVRVEVEMDEGMMFWEFRNISIDPIPDDIFILPEGVTIIG